MKEKKDSHNLFLEAFYVCLKERYNPDDKSHCLSTIDMFIDLANNFIESFSNSDIDFEEKSEKIREFKKSKAIFEDVRKIIENDEMPKGIKADEPNLEVHVERLVCRFKKLAA